MVVDATEGETERPRYFVLAYDSGARRVLSLSGHDHDYTGAVLTLRPDLLARHAELFAGLALLEG